MREIAARCIESVASVIQNKNASKDCTLEAFLFCLRSILTEQVNSFVLMGSKSSHFIWREIVFMIHCGQGRALMQEY